MNLFEQVKPKELNKIQKNISNNISDDNLNKEQENQKKAIKRRSKKSKKKKDSTNLPAQEIIKNEFNDLELVGEIQEQETHKAEDYPQPYVFSTYKNNLFSLYLNCDKFLSNKPYFQFALEKNLFLSNENFNDFFDIKGKNLILNIDDFAVISFIIKNFKKELKNIQYIIVFNKKFPKKYFEENNFEFKTNERKCNICPFLNLKGECTLTPI